MNPYFVVMQKGGKVTEEKCLCLCVCVRVRARVGECKIRSQWQHICFVHSKILSAHISGFVTQRVYTNVQGTYNTEDFTVYILLSYRAIG